MRYTVKGSWRGWSGDTIVEMMDGSIWRQAEYLYEYFYAYMPQATIRDDIMHVDGMSNAVRVRRLK